MAVSTVYDVKVRYTVKDKASTGFARLSKSANRASRSVVGLNRVMRTAAAAAIGFLGFRAAKSALIDFNVGMEQAKITMGGLLNLNMGGTFNDSMKDAGTLVRQFQEDAKKSVATTEDFVRVGSLVVGPLSRAGATMKDIRDVTKGAVIAAKAFGVESGQAALDIEQALAGTLTKKDRFARALLEPMDITTDKWNAMVKQTPGLAVKALVAAFGQSSIKEMAERQAKSFAGITSTLKDNFQRMFGRVGLPLMKAMADEFARINKFFDENSTKVTRIVKGLSSGLMAAFTVVKSVVSTVAENPKLFLALAGAAVAMKGVSAITGSVGAIGMLSKTVGGLPATFGKVSGIIGKMSVGLLGLVGPFGIAAIALGAAGAALLGVQKRLQDASLKDLAGGARTAGLANTFGTFARDRGQRASVGERAGAASFGVNVGTLRARNARTFATQQGFLSRGEGGKSTFNAAAVVKQFNLGAINETVADKLISTSSFKEFQTAAVVHSEQLGRAGDNLTVFLQGIAKILRLEEKFAEETIFQDRFTQKVDKQRKNTGNKSQTNITISRIEVASEDPDRFAFNLIDAMQDVANNRSQALNTLPET